MMPSNKKIKENTDEKQKNLLRKIFDKYHEGILYIIFGGLTTIVSYVFQFLPRGLGAPLWLATALSWIFAVTFAFVTNKIFVFKSKASSMKDLLRQIISFYLARGASLLIDMLVMMLGAGLCKEFFIELFGLESLNYTSGIFSLGFLNTPEKFNEVIFKLISNVIILIINYAISKLVIFRKSPNKEEQKN